MKHYQKGEKNSMRIYRYILGKYVKRGMKHKKQCIDIPYIHIAKGCQLSYNQVRQGIKILEEYKKIKVYRIWELEDGRYKRKNWYQVNTFLEN